MKRIQIIIAVILLILSLGCGKENDKSSDNQKVSKTFKIQKKTKNVPKTDLNKINAGKAADASNKNKLASKSSIPQSAVNTNKAEKAETDLIAEDLAYDPQGRIDPFAPLFQGHKEDKRSSKKRKTFREKRVKLTPLEKFDIGQLKLVAVIMSKHRNIGMVEEATGKGYVVKKGSYIGINSGRVVEIQKDKIIVEEEVEDYMDKIIIRKRELKLQKPLGE